MRKVLLIACAIFAWSAASAWADDSPPMHYCTKPIKPFQFNDQWQVDSFMDEVRRYKQCLVDFIDEQNWAIENHQQAAQDAIDEWNRFVQLEMN